MCNLVEPRLMESVGFYSKKNLVPVATNSLFVFISIINLLSSLTLLLMRWIKELYNFARIFLPFNMIFVTISFVD